MTLEDRPISTKPSEHLLVALVRFGISLTQLVPMSAARVYEQIRSFGSLRHRLRHVHGVKDNEYLLSKSIQCCD